jgi:hypothetical protein
MFVATSNAEAPTIQEMKNAVNANLGPAGKPAAFGAEENQLVGPQTRSANSTHPPA